MIGKLRYQYSFPVISDKYNMNANLDKIAQDLYGKIQTRFPNIQMGDENAGVLSKKEDIPNARFFEFEYEENGESLGTIAITLDAQDGIVLQVSGDLVNDNSNTTHHSAYKFIRGFRSFAKDRLLNFDVQNIGKSNLDKRDYEFQAKRKENAMPAIMENKMYGNARMSYQDLGENARLVVKHTQPINMELAAGRTMHIDSIYIENAQGERFRYPAKHLNGARALAEHIKAGGNPYDLIGKHICSLSEELASLRKFKGYVNRQEQVSEAMGSVTDRVLERIEQIKETIHKLQRPAYYQSFVETFEAQEEQMIPEEIANDLIDRLTIRTFNEELKAVFPYIYKFVDESELDVLEIGVDDLLAENPLLLGLGKAAQKIAPAAVSTAKNLPHAGMDPIAIKAYNLGVELGKIAKINPKDPRIGEYSMSKLGLPKEYYDHFSSGFHLIMPKGIPEAIQPEDQYESFMNDIVREDKDELFSPNKSAQQTAIKQLNDILSQPLMGGPQGINAIQSLKGLIDDPEFLQSLQDIDPELDIRPLVQQFILQKDPELSMRLNFSGEDNDAPAPAAPAPEAPPAPAPEAPPAEAPPAEAPPAEAPPPAPVAEATDDSPPWDVDPKEKKSKPTTPGKHGQGYSQARHLARQGMADAMKKAVKAGAKLETQLDFGHGVKTIQEILSDCGMSPQDVGMEMPVEGGLPAMLKFISGFYNKDEGNFPLGGMRIKIKVKKGFEDGEFGEASDDDLIKVLKFIDMKDPSDEANHHEQQHVLKLAGVSPQPQMHEPEAHVSPISGHSDAHADSLARIMQLVSR